MAKSGRKAAFAALETHKKRLNKMPMRELFAADPSRFGKFSAKAGDILLDYSKNRVDAEVMAALNALPPDAIVANGAGNYAGWIHRFRRFTRYGTQAAPASGSMGYGLPAAIAAKRLFPEREVVAVAGDGCFMMTGQELATAVQHELALTVVVIDNGQYGTIRMHQEREFPGRISATKLKNPDFAAYAVAFGGHGETVTTAAEFGPAFERALASGKPAILHCRMDPEAITPMTTITRIREQALAK